MAHNPIISIIIPAYNSGKFIESTLASVSNQTFTDFEIIVIDDGSTDNTAEIVKHAQTEDLRIKYHYKTNGGVSSARNMGIAHAQGQFISFLDSDDILKPTFLEKMHAQITTGKYYLVWCGHEDKLAEVTLCQKPTQFGIEDILLFIINESWLSTDSWMIKKEWLIETGILFPPNISHGEDFEFFCKLIVTAGKESITCVPEYLVDYRHHSDSLSEKNSTWYSSAFISQGLEASMSVYNFLCQQEKPNKEYIVGMGQKAKKLHLFWLWGTLILGKKEDFKILYSLYRQDASIRTIQLYPASMKFRIWEFFITTPVVREMGRYVFRPYKFIQRQIKTARLRK